MTDESTDVPAEGTDHTTHDESVAGPGELNRTAANSPSLHEHQLVMTLVPSLAVALLAGLAVWGTLEMIMPVFRLPEHLTGLSNAPEAELQAMRDALRGNEDRNAVLVLVVMAFTLALVLTATEMFYRRDLVRAVWGGLLAGLIAGVIAIGAGALAVVLHDAIGLRGAVEHESSRLGKTMVVQVAMLGVVGIGIGIAIGIPMFRLRLLTTCAAGCLMGGLLAALIFPITASVCLPNVNTELLVPLSGMGRLLWVGLATGLMGATVSGLGKSKNKTGAGAT